MAEQSAREPWSERWVNGHPDAQELLTQIISGEPGAFYRDPHPSGVLLAQDRQSYIMRVGALLGARKITVAYAAALVRGLGVSILNPDEQEAAPTGG